MPRRLLLRAALLTLLAGTFPLAGAANEPAGGVVPTEAAALTFAVFPYVSATQLVRFHAPLRDHIARVLDRPVTLVTAPDFQTFVDRTRKGLYDVVFTAPHFGRYAEQRDGYRRVVRTTNEIYGVYLVPAASSARRIEDLAGMRIMMAQRLAVIFQMAEQELRQKGLVADRAAVLIETSTHNNAMSAPLRGDADAAVIPAGLWQALGHDHRDRLREIGRTRSVPGAMILAHPRLPASELAALQSGLLAFPDSDSGQRYFAATGMLGFGPISHSDMESLDPYLAILDNVR